MLEESDSSGSEEENASNSGTAPSPLLADEPNEDEGDEADFSSVGEYNVPVGWIALDPPAADEAEWASTKKSFKWNNLKLAHIWNEPTGWQIASFTHWDRVARMCCFFYPSDGQKVIHDLPLHEYGIDGHWVILRRCS